MKNTIKLLGIAIAVLLTFGLIGCGDPEETETEIAKTIIIADSASSGSGTESSPWPVGTELTADYQGPETGLKYQWQYQPGAGGAWQDIGDNSDTLVADKEGRYRVTVTVEGKENTPSNSAVVWVKNSEGGGGDITEASFVGTWKFVIGEALSDPTGRANLQQTITITADEFKITEPNTTEYFTYRVDSWWERSLNANKNGIAAIPASESVAARVGWTLSNGNTGDYALSKYTAAFPNVYELAGARTAGNGTGYASTPERFFLMINDAGTKFVRTSIAAQGTSTSITSCVYVKQAAE
jgi:hypothetical protein